nr:hypothetical protein CFP56_70128 [Quercus suber]
MCDVLGVLQGWGEEGSGKGGQSWTGGLVASCKRAAGHHTRIAYDMHAVSPVGYPTYYYLIRVSTQPAPFASAFIQFAIRLRATSGIIADRPTGRLSKEIEIGKRSAGCRSATAVHRCGWVFQHYLPGRVFGHDRLAIIGKVVGMLQSSVPRHSHENHHALPYKIRDRWRWTLD